MDGNKIAPKEESRRSSGSSESGATGLSAKKVKMKRRMSLEKGAVQVLTSDPIKIFFTDVLHNKYFEASIWLFTIWALFADDIRIIAAPPSADEVFYVFHFIALCLFIYEFVANCLTEDNYIFGYFFWMDLAAALTMIPDVPWLVELFVANDDADVEGLQIGRASRAGTRVGRIVKIVRLIRMVRIIKIWKAYALRNSGGHEINVEDVKREPSKVGQILSMRTIQYVILIVLTMILVLPFFDGGLDTTFNTYQTYGIQNLHRLPQDYNQSGLISETMLKKTVQSYARFSGKILSFEVCPKFCRNVWNKSKTDAWIKSIPEDYPEEYASLKGKGVTLDNCKILLESEVTDYGYCNSLLVGMYTEEQIKTEFRVDERPLVRQRGCFEPCPSGEFPPNSGVPYTCTLKEKYGVVSEFIGGCESRVYFDIKDEIIHDAVINIVKVLSVMIIIVCLTFTFSHDAQTLVIGPIERMIAMVNVLRDDPMSQNLHKEDNTDAKDKKKAKSENYETAFIEDTFNKIAGLMRVGFGAAGIDIIGENMKSHHDDDIDPKVPGRRIVAIYMFCDIRKFTDTTECLQEDIMTFVNTLGDMVHSSTHGYYGMANKNVGDAFLLSWKIKEENLQGYSSFNDIPSELDYQAAMKTICDNKNSGAGNVAREDITAVEIANSAFYATVKIQNDLLLANRTTPDGRVGQLVPFLDHEVIRKRMFKKDPNFEIRMGSGLHVGWCIEGAIGSQYKIDCTYLSPHAEMSDRLEAGSKIYGTPINMSHWMYNLICPELRKYCRPMDRIFVEGCPVPMTIYTFDIFTPVHSWGLPSTTFEGLQLPLNKKDFDTLANLQETLPNDFMRKWANVWKLYSTGKWENLLPALDDFLALRSDDGPAKRMKKYVQKHNGVPPNHPIVDEYSKPENSHKHPEQKLQFGEVYFVNHIAEGY